MVALLSLAALVLGTTFPHLVDLSGHRNDLFSEAGGKPVALVFIAHDCPISNTYAPELARIARDYRSDALFGLVYEERNFTAAQAREHAASYGYKGVHLFLDPTGKAARASGAGITPEAVVFDGKGRRTYLGRIDDLFYDFGKQRPAATKHDFRNALNATISHRPVKPATGPPFGCVIETTN